jgi:hypothetical protein
MQSRQRRLVQLIPLVLLLTACGSGTGSGQRDSSAASGTPGAPSASRTNQLSDASLTSGASSTVSQTDTAWGRIWDALPPGFPRYPGAAPADDAAATPSSGRYAVAGGDPEEIAAWLQAAMQSALFTTDVSGPLEDGTFTLDSVGVAGCRIQTTVAPLGGMTIVTVLYAAGCPVG